MTEHPMRVEVWSDIVCPWCAIGRKHLRDAIAATGLPVQVIHRAFELDPTRTTSAPAEEHLRSRYGDRAPAMMDHVAELAAAEGLTLRTRQAIAANTFDAHRLILWAQQQGRGEAVLDRLVRAHFEESLDVGNHALLERLASDLGLEGAAEVLASATMGNDVRADEARARQLGIGGVPFAVVAGRYGVSGAQPVEVFVEALQAGHRKHE